MVVCAVYLTWTTAGPHMSELLGLEKDPMLAEILPVPRCSLSLRIACFEASFMFMPRQKFTDLSPLDTGDVVVSRYDHRKYKVIKLNNSIEVNVLPCRPVGLSCHRFSRIALRQEAAADIPSPDSSICLRPPYALSHCRRS